MPGLGFKGLGLRGVETVLGLLGGLGVGLIGIFGVVLGFSGGFDRSLVHGTSRAFYSQDSVGFRFHGPRDPSRLGNPYTLTT